MSRSIPPADDASITPDGRSNDRAGADTPLSIPGLGGSSAAFDAEVRSRLVRGYLDAVDRSAVGADHAMHSLIVTHLGHRHQQLRLPLDGDVFATEVRKLIDEWRDWLDGCRETIRIGDGAVRRVVDSSTRRMEFTWRLMPHLLLAIGESAGGMKIQPMVRAVLGIANGSRGYDRLARTWARAIGADATEILESEHAQSSFAGVIRANVHRLVSHADQHEARRRRRRSSANDFPLADRLRFLAEGQESPDLAEAAHGFRIQFTDKLHDFGEKRLSLSEPP